MKITVDRFDSNDNETVSKISVDGVRVCYGLEDEYREVKIKGDTRIPAGSYRVAVRNYGGFHERYSKRFAFHQGMLQVCDVPGFSDILIHIGNTDDDTAGCLLVGVSVECGPHGMSLLGSTTAYEKLYRMVIDAAKSGELSIEYVDNDRKGC